MIEIVNKYMTQLGLFIFVAILCILLCFATGTGDNGDSISHYLNSKAAFIYPEYYFNHWSKPFFIFITSPYCQFGFKAIQSLNVLFTIFIAIFTYLFACKFHYKLPWISLWIFITSPLVYQLSISGLTEPMFGFFLIVSLYYLLDFPIFSLLLISFTPFIRSEGLILIGCTIIYLVYQRKFLLIPILSVGHIVYSIIGYSVHKDYFWVFTQIPYLGFQSNYGNGNLFHFIKNMYQIIGFPNTLIFYWSILYGIYLFVIKKTKNIQFQDYEFFLFGFTGCFLLFHIVAWAFGWFNSFGLLRVIIPIIPFIGLWVNRLVVSFTEVKQYFISYFIILIVGSFVQQFGNKKYQLDHTQIADISVYNYIVEHKINRNRVLTNRFYLKLLLNLDIKNVIEKCNINSNKIPKGTILVWDSWYSVIDNQINKDDIIRTNQYDIIKTFTTKSANESNFEEIIFRKK